MIGMDGCGGEEPSSGIYVNSLPGISTHLASKIADNEQITWAGLWSDVQDRALKKFNTSVINAFKTQKAQRIKSVAQMVDLGRGFSNASPLAAFGQYRGFTVEITFPAGVTVNYSLASSLQVIYFQEVSLYSTEVKTVTFKVFNLDSSEELDSFTADVVAGWNRIRLAKSYDAYRIFVGYDATDFISGSTVIPSLAYASCQECGSCVYGYGECNSTVSGALTADLADPTEYTKGSDTFGLSAVFSIQCRYDWLICGNKDLFTVAYQNLLGAELLSHLIYTNRVNAFTQPTQKEAAKQLRHEYLTEFDKELAIAVGGIDISEDDCCVECEAVLQKPYLLP